MDELENLYSVLKSQELFSKDFETFSELYKDQEYRKKVYDVAVGKQLFSKDYETFISTYSPPTQAEVKMKGNAVQDAAVLPEEDGASKSVDSSSDSQKTEGELTFEDTRSKDEKIVSYEEQLKDFLFGDWYKKVDPDMTEEERLAQSKLMVKPPPGSPADQNQRYYDMWTNQRDYSAEEDDVAGPVYFDADEMQRNYQELKGGGYNFEQMIKDGGSFDDVVQVADSAIDEIIHSDKYFSEQFVPYVQQKHLGELSLYRDELIKDYSINGNFDPSVIENKLNERFSEIFNEELKQDEGYKQLVLTATGIVSEDLNIDAKAFNKSKELPDWIEGSSVLEGTYKMSRGFLQGVKGEKAARLSRYSTNLQNVLNAYKDENLSDQEKKDIATEYLDRTDLTALYPETSITDPRALEKIKAADPVDYLEKAIRGTKVMYLEGMTESLEYQEALSYLDNPEIFDGDFTFDDVKRMTGEQLPQMAAAILSLGSTTYLQEAGGNYVETVMSLASDKYGEDFDNADLEKKKEYLIDLIESGEDQPDKAIFTGIANAGLDLASNIFVAGKAVKLAPKSLFRGTLKEAIKKAEDLGGDMLKAGFLEGLTEGSQEFVSMVQTGRARGVYDIDTNRILEAAGQGAFMSTLFIGGAKSIQTIPDVANSGLIAYEKAFNKDNIYSITKLQKAKLQKKLKDKTITPQKYKESLQEIKDSERLLEDTGLYKIRGEQRKPALKSASDYLSAVKLKEKKQSELESIKGTNASDLALKTREKFVDDQEANVQKAYTKLQRFQILKAYQENKGKISSKINNSQEGALKDVQIFNFKTRKEANNWLKKHNIPITGNVAGLFSKGKNKVNAVAFKDAVEVNGQMVRPGITIEENVVEKIMSEDYSGINDAIGAFAESHEGLHFVLDTLDPKKVNSVVTNLKSALSKSREGTVERSLYDYVTATQKEYASDKNMTQETLDQEFLTSLSDALHFSKALEPKTPLAELLGSWGDRLRGFVDINTGLTDVNIDTPTQVFQFLSSYRNFGSKSSGRINLRNQVESVTVKDDGSIGIVRAQKSKAEMQKDALVSSNKALLPLIRTYKSRQKQLDENVAIIKELNKKIQKEKDEAIGIDFSSSGKAISEESKGITRKNKLLWNEIWDEDTSPAEVEKLKQQVLELNMGTIKSVFNMTFNKDLARKGGLQKDDYLQDLMAEAMTLIGTYGEGKNKNARKVPFNAYLKPILLLRTGSIFERNKPTYGWFPDDVVGEGAKQIQDESLTGNWTDEEYVQETINVIEELGIDEDIKSQIKDAAVKAIKNADIDTANLKQLLSSSLMLNLKNVIQSKVLGSKERDYKAYMIKNWDKLYSVLPIDALNNRFTSLTQQEKDNNLPNPFVMKLTDSNGKQIRESRIVDGSGKGKGISYKKRNITQEEWMDWFFWGRGRIDNFSTQGTRKDTLAETIAEQAGFDYISYLLSNDEQFLQDFRDAQNLLYDRIVGDLEIENIQKQINRNDRSRPMTTRAQRVASVAQKYDLGTNTLNAMLDDLRGNNLRDYSYGLSGADKKEGEKFNTIRDELYKAIGGAIGETVQLYHGSKQLKINSKEDLNGFKIKGFGFHVGTMKAAEDRLNVKSLQANQGDGKYMNEIHLNLDPDKEIFFDQDHFWESVDEPFMVSSIYDTGYANAMNIMDELNNIEPFTLYDTDTEVYSKATINDGAFTFFPRDLVDRGIMTAKDVEKLVDKSLQKTAIDSYNNPSGEPKSFFGDELRQFLVEKGYDYIKYVNQAEDPGSFSYIVLNKDVMYDGYTKGEVALLDDLKKLDNVRAQLVGKNKKFNDIIEQASKGKIKSKTIITAGGAKATWKKQSRWRKVFRGNTYLPYSAEDFVGLTRVFTPSGKDGDAAIDFIDKKILDPYYDGKEAFREFKQRLNEKYNALFDKSPNRLAKGLSSKETVGVITKAATVQYQNKIESDVRVGKITKEQGDKLISEFKGETFSKHTLKETFEFDGMKFSKGQAVKVWLWVKQGEKIDPDIISQDEVQKIVDFMKRPENYRLIIFANQLSRLTQEGDGNGIKYSDDMALADISIDIYKYAEGRRKEFFGVFKENVDIVFSEKNKLKLEALYGKDYVNALNSSLERMYSGKNDNWRDKSAVKKGVMGWVNASVNSIMFLNLRSAALQLISFANFMNWGDNNAVAMTKAYANAPQFGTDLKMLWNSSYLKDRRTELSFAVEADRVIDIAVDAASGEQNMGKAIMSTYAKMAKLGYTPTRYADSLAIAFGGAPFYRNRYNTYISEGKSEKVAHKKALRDFERIAEESQQSSDPSKTSDIQIGDFGRFMFAFANTPFQYARLSKRAVQDIINGRGDWKTNISKLAYYSLVQQMIFSSLQGAMNVFDLGLFDWEDEDGEEVDAQDKTAAFYTINGVLENHMKMFGVGGVAAMAAKNMALTKYQTELFRDQKDSDETGLLKSKRPTPYQYIVDILKVSPPMSSKIKQAEDIYKIETWSDYREKSDFYDATDFYKIYPQDPAWEKYSKMSNLLFNVPLDRVHRKLENISIGLDEQTDFYQSALLFGGWTKYNLLDREDWDIAYPEKDKASFKRFQERLKVQKKRVRDREKLMEKRRNRRKK